MKTFHLVVSTPSAGVEVIKMLAMSEEDATVQFESDTDNDGCELLHVIEPESLQVEVVVDMTGGCIHQVLSNHANTKIIFLDSHKEEIAIELENAEGNFAPDIDLDGDPVAQPRAPWVFRETVVEHNPRVAHHYIAYSEDEAAREAFSAKVHEALDN